jgi:hypothetical protein
MCDSYGCVWLKEWSFPDWMRPDKVGFIMTLKSRENTVMITSDFTTGQMDGAALLWVIQWCTDNDCAIVYTVKGKEDEGDYVRGNIKNHPRCISKTGPLTEIFEPIELLLDDE